MVVANRVIGRSDRFQRRLSSQEGRAMASRVNREVYARFCGRLEVKFLRPTRRQPPVGPNPWRYRLKAAGHAPRAMGRERSRFAIRFPTASGAVDVVSMTTERPGAAARRAAMVLSGS